MGLKRANGEDTQIFLKSQEAKGMRWWQRNPLDYLCKNVIFVLA